MKLHIYRKSIIKPNYYSSTKEIPLYVDDRYITDMKPGDTINLEITPGTHKIVIKAPGLLMAPVTSEFTADENSTDIYVAFRGRLGKYIDPKIFEIKQFKASDLMVSTTQRAKVTFISEDISLKCNIYCNITVDGQPVGHLDGYNPRLEFIAAKGKHFAFLESYYEAGYACIDVKDFSDSTIVMIDDCDILDIQPHFPKTVNSNSQVKCVFSRPSQFRGCAGTTKIVIDGELRLNLKNGETKEVLLSEGNHCLMLKANSIRVVDFVVPENSNKVIINLVDIDKIQSIVAE